MADTEFRSPLRKLVTFFKVSRDKCKEKCRQVKYELKLIKRRFKNLQKNRNLWQQRYQEAETGRGGWGRAQRCPSCSAMIAVPLACISHTDRLASTHVGRETTTSSQLQ